jgi:hypothetical protein
VFSVVKAFNPTTENTGLNRGETTETASSSAENSPPV